MSETMAEASTRLLRNSDDPLYARLRGLLAERGVDVDRAVLAAFFPDDSNQEFGVIVTPERCVYEFHLHYGKGDLDNQVTMATIDWRVLTQSWESGRSRAYVEDGLRLLGVV
jgi:hypothetical protein